MQGRSFRWDLWRGAGDELREFIVPRAFQVALAMVFGSGKLLRSFKPENDLLVPTFCKWTLLCERRVIWDHVRPWEGVPLGDPGAELGQDTVPAELRTQETGTHSREAQISRGQLEAGPLLSPHQGRSRRLSIWTPLCTEPGHPPGLLVRGPHCVCRRLIPGRQSCGSLTVSHRG